MSQRKIKVLFVCKGNICRSPTAHGIFRDIIKAKGYESTIEVASCGTSSQKWGHVGDQADFRAQEIAEKYDCDLSDQKSQQLLRSDFDKYDYIITMDQENIETMKVIFPKVNFTNVSKMLQYAPAINLTDVPDPYYEDNFEKVFLMIDTACHGLFEKIKLENKL